MPRIAFDKVKWVLLILILIGLSLRVYHLDFPPIGYHNMKEMEYLSEAREFYDHGDYLHRMVAWMGMDSASGPGYFEEYAQLPILPWLILLGWKVLGIHLWVGRLIIVLFSLGIIPLTYYVCYELTKKKEPSIYAALFMTVIPIAVFFGRNIQPESPALFFIMLATYYYLKWINDFIQKYIMLSLISFSMAALFKYTFMIFVIPFLFIFPFEKLREEDYRKKLVRQIPSIILCLFPLFLWALVSKIENVNSEALFTYERIRLFEIYSSEYWGKYFEIITGYLVSNFTIFYLVLAFIGLLFCLRQIKTKFCKYCFGSVFMAIPYFMLLSDYIRQHSYYQMPFIPLVSMASAFAVYKISTLEIVKSEKLKYFIVIGIVLISLPTVKQSIDMHYDRIFFGLDAAGNSIKELSSKGDRVYLAGHVQTVGMLWNADRYGAFLPDTLERFKFGEDERNMKWIFVYDNNEKLRENPEIWEYVTKNYSLREIGVLKSDEVEKPVYFILEKGGSIDFSNTNFNSRKLKTRYKTSYGELELYSLRAD